MRYPSSGKMRRILVTPAEADRWARRGSKLRRVFDRLADGLWHRGGELHRAYNAGNPDPTRWGWEWQSCISQLRKKLRDEGGDIESESIKGRDEYRYRMILPKQARLRPHLERTQRTLQQMGLDV